MNVTDTSHLVFTLPLPPLWLYPTLALSISVFLPLTKHFQHLRFPLNHQHALEQQFLHRSPLRNHQHEVLCYHPCRPGLSLDLLCWSHAQIRQHRHDDRLRKLPSFSRLYLRPLN